MACPVRHEGTADQGPPCAAPVPAGAALRKLTGRTRHRRYCCPVSWPARTKAGGGSFSLPLFFLHAGGEVRQQSFQIPSGAQFRQKLSGLCRCGPLRQFRQKPHGPRVPLFRSPGKGLNGRIPPSPAVLAVQGKGQFPYPRQKNRFGVFRYCFRVSITLAGFSFSQSTLMKASWASASWSPEAAFFSRGAR